MTRAVREPGIRQALSPVFLGQLYNAYTNELLPSRSILKDAQPPAGAVVTVDTPSLYYRYAMGDTLTERLVSFGISADVGIDLICGRVRGNGWMG